MRRLNASWRDEQTVRMFPFEDASSLQTLEGLTLPMGMILDASVHPPNSIGGYYLESVAISANAVTFAIADSDDQAVATGQWSSQLPDASVVPLYDLDLRRAGVLVVSPETIRQMLIDLDSGTHVLDSTSARFVPSTWEYTRTLDQQQGVGDVTVTSQEDLYLVGENGIHLECKEVDGQNVVVVHAIGDPLATRAACGETFVTPRFLQQVVFQHGDQTIACEYSAARDVLIVVASYEGQDGALRLQNTDEQIRLGFLSNR